MPLSQSGDDALCLHSATTQEGEDAATAMAIAGQDQHKPRNSFYASAQQQSPVVSYIDWAEPTGLTDGSDPPLSSRVLSLVALVLRIGIPLSPTLLHRCVPHNFTTGLSKPVLYKLDIIADVGTSNTV